MGKINGSEAKLGIKVASTHGTAVALGAGDGMCFESLEWSDNVTQLEFNSKGCGKAMKNAIRQGFKSPTVRLTYHLKYGGNQYRLLAGFLGSTTETPVVLTSGQGDYIHRSNYNKDRQFFTIASQTTTSTSVEWASCYPVGLNISSQVGEPVTVSIDFVATERNNTPSTNTFSALNSVSETTTADYCIYGKSGGSYLIVHEANGDTWSDRVENTGFTYNLQRPMELIPETYATVKPAPISTGLLMATLQVDMVGLDDHTYLNYQQQDKTWQTTLRALGADINSGRGEQFIIESGAMKFNADLQTSISSDGVNSASMTYEHIYQNDLSLTTAEFKDIYFKLVSKDASAYF